MVDRQMGRDYDFNLPSTTFADLSDFTMPL
jgi:hypothetical protein